MATVPSKTQAKKIHLTQEEKSFSAEKRTALRPLLYMRFSHCQNQVTKWCLVRCDQTITINYATR